MKVPNTKPQDLDELMTRSANIAGLSLGELADIAGLATPANLRHHKGWAGQLIELWLGASAGSKPQQDFPELGVELKTLPLGADGRPLETTYVCYAPLSLPLGTTWESCNVRNKLQHVLWVPLEGEREIPVAHRRIATPFLWQPSVQQDTLLKADWEELNELIALGEVESITARHGNVLQMRPKAANGGVLTDALGPEGEKIKTRPRGYYLRKQFTQMILSETFA